MNARVQELRPSTVDYRGHCIKMTHRPRTNDWIFSVEHTSTITLRSHAVHYEQALAQAKREIDILMGDRDG